MTGQRGSQLALQLQDDQRRIIRFRQAGYRARHQRNAPVSPASASRTASGVYECSGCGERLAGQRRCEQCNLYARRIDDGGACHACGEIITITELLTSQ